MTLNFNKRIDKSRWFDFEGAQFLIAPIDNANYQQHIASSVKFGDYLALAADKGKNLDDSDLLQLSFKDLSVTEVKRKTSEALSLHVVLGWKGIVDNDNNPVNYNSELCQSYLDQDPDFAAFVQESADKIANESNIEAAAKVKKLKTGSTGK